MRLNQIWLHFLTKIATKIHFRSTCLLMISDFTLDFSKKQLVTEQNLGDAGWARISVGTFSCINFPVCVRGKRALIGRLVCSVDIIYELWEAFFVLFFLLFCNLNCCLRELLGVFFLYSLPACFQPKYDNVSHQRRAPPAGFTCINYWGLLPPQKNIKNV